MNAWIASYSLLATACSVIFTAASHAHEFIIKPTQDWVELGAEVPFSILATHVFMVSEEAYATEKFGRRHCLCESHESGSLDGLRREAHRNQRQGLRPSIA